MILADYFLSTPSVQWQLGKQLGVNNAVVRLPEDPEFDITNPGEGDGAVRFVKPLAVKAGADFAEAAQFTGQRIR